MTISSTVNGWRAWLKTELGAQSDTAAFYRPNLRTRVTTSWFFGVSPFDDSSGLRWWQRLWGGLIFLIFYAPSWVLYAAWRSIRSWIGRPIKDAG